MSDESIELSAEQVIYYRNVLLTHVSVRGAGMCHICGVAHCPDWVDAYDKLAAANAQMVDASNLPPGSQSAVDEIARQARRRGDGWRAGLHVRRGSANPARHQGWRCPASA